MTSGVYCVSYSLDASKSDITSISSAGLRFIAGEYRYLATSLHGRFSGHMQEIPRRGAVLLADGFRADGHLAIAHEIGPVMCDWRNDYVDVALIHLLGDLSTDGAWYTEDAVTEDAVLGYMIPLMRKVASKDLVPSDPSSFRVLVHPGPRFRGVGSIPGAIVSLEHTVSLEAGSKHRWQFLVQLDAGHEVNACQSGSAVTLASDGRPIGMLVSHWVHDRSIAIVTPLHHIFASLNSVMGTVRLCSFHNDPLRVDLLPRATKRVLYGEVRCLQTSRPYSVKLSSAAGLLDCCCSWHTEQANKRVEQMMSNPFSHIPTEKQNTLPDYCLLWESMGEEDADQSSDEFPIRTSPIGPYEQLISQHLLSPSDATWYEIVRSLQPNQRSNSPSTHIRWTYPELVSAWSMQPSGTKVTANQQPTHCCNKPIGTTVAYRTRMDCASAVRASGVPASVQ